MEEPTGLIPTDASFSFSDVGDADIYHIGRGFAPRTRTHVKKTKSYYGREETKYNRSEWCRGRALTFKTIGHGVAPRQRF